MKHFPIILTVTALGILASCRSHYAVVDVNRTRILVDDRYDVGESDPSAKFIAPYKQKVDSMMKPVVGEAAHYMVAMRPESGLSNLLADILVWGAAQMNERVDFAVYNMGGIRAAIAAGKVTKGDIVDVAPFENKLCVLSLKGDKVMELFAEMAASGGEGVSHGVALRISGDGRLLSAKLNGGDVNPLAVYRVATLDYLAQGNDKLEAFKAKTDTICPQDESNNVRYIIMDYFRQKGKVSSQVEGRIVVEK